jgi:hypothetical protein
VLMRNGGGEGVGEKTSLSEIHNEKMLTRCDCSMAIQWSIKTNLEERDRSWCETGSERIVTGSGEREGEWTWCCVMNCGIVHSAGNHGKSLFVLSCLVKTWPLVIFLYLHNGIAMLSKVLAVSWRFLHWDHGFETRQKHLCKFNSFCVILTCEAYTEPVQWVIPLSRIKEFLSLFWKLILNLNSQKGLTHYISI